ncbi:SDR family oxidoreductase [Aurantibacter crassamenti]|uniref:SDR family NAD(P)-dependent oxidoreductase n=1 Tax=Aurantibacter crassamenti TaxID=1837375 RepID=UPI0019395861|nr:SDR family oxidoreductase [Aurantibacter crassamenti]MBM1106851.1 SDR family oxidoreductase [Aurantibacter crassamenti]
MKKNIVLIGGSHGIGRSVVNQLHKNYNLFVASRSKEDLGDLDITHITFDAISEELDVNVLPDKIDGFVYLPGSINLKPFKMLAIETFEADMLINFFSMVRIVKSIIPKMADASSMVFFSSVAAQKGMPYHTSIAAAKGAIEGFGKSLAAEYAPKIRINMIAPSLTDTKLAERLLNNDRKKEANALLNPLKRIGKADDIANMVVFLLSEKSSWMTGQIIGVDGGASTLNNN